MYCETHPNYSHASRYVEHPTREQQRGTNLKLSTSNESRIRKLTGSISSIKGKRIKQALNPLKKKKKKRERELALETRLQDLPRLSRPKSRGGYEKRKKRLCPNLGLNGSTRPISRGEAQVRLVEAIKAAWCPQSSSCSHSKFAFTVSFLLLLLRKVLSFVSVTSSTLSFYRNCLITLFPVL